MLLDNGWGVYEASQQRATKDITRNDFTRHMLRLRKLEDFDRSAVVGDGVGEVILINAHDGTGAYHLKAGYFRFVCSNGMISGNTMAGFKVLHSINKATSEEVLGAAERIITGTFPKLLENVGRFKSLELSRPYQARLAEKGLALRYPNTLPPYDATNLLAVRREEDEAPTLWNVLNRVQEHVIYGGDETTSRGFGRKSVVRPVERVSSVVTINGGLWDEAFAIAEELS